MKERIPIKMNGCYDDWFREYITKENGIWVGNGIEDQYIFDLKKFSNHIRILMDLS